MHGRGTGGVISRARERARWCGSGDRRYMYGRETRGVRARERGGVGVKIDKRCGSARGQVGTGDRWGLVVWEWGHAGGVAVGTGDVGVGTGGVAVGTGGVHGSGDRWCGSGDRRCGSGDRWCPWECMGPRDRWCPWEYMHGDRWCPWHETSRTQEVQMQKPRSQALPSFCCWAGPGNKVKVSEQQSLQLHTTMCRTVKS